MLGLVSAIENIIQDKVLKDADKVNRIKVLLPENDDTALATLRGELATEIDSDDYHEILEACSIRLQNRVSPILKTLELQGESDAKPLLAALTHFKLKEGNIDKTTPTEFLNEEEFSAVTTQERFRISLYKVFLFLQVQGGIKSGILNLSHSYKFRPIDNYLIEPRRWQRDREILIERAGLQHFADPQQVPTELEDALIRQYKVTNRHISEKSNELVSFDSSGRFRLKTPKKETTDAQPLRNFFSERQYVSLLEVLATVDQHSGFLDAFPVSYTRPVMGRNLR